MNQQFWPQISSSFSETIMQSTGYLLLMIILGLILVLILGYYIYQRFRAGKKSEAPSAFEVASTDRILDIMGQALELNSRFDLRLDGVSREIFCVLRNYDSSFVYLEPPAQLKASAKLRGRDISVFFKLKPPGQKLSFYKFKSEIVQVIPEDNLFILKIRMPSSLSMDQKRQHLRLEGPMEYIRYLMVRPVPYDEKGNFSQYWSNFKEPFWKVESGSTNPEMTLMDISGGGIRIRVSSHSLGDKEEFLKNHPSLLLSLVIVHGDDSSDEPEEFHVIARVKKHYYDGMGNHILAMQYEHRAMVDEESNAITAWKSIPPEDGVEEITTWVVKTHLKLYREKGLV